MNALTDKIKSLDTAYIKQKGVNYIVINVLDL